ncbi:MAG: WD40 repeat domain-containing protein, partial [Alkalinema sp. CAN_BIN05]|nr:WD40 repeat domain-containing protein [Alkalinema sp. CAN_BIN05]
ISKVPIFCSVLMGDRIFTASADSQLSVIVQGKITHTEPLSSPMSKTMTVNTDRKWIAIGDDRGSVHCFDAQGNLHKSFVGCPGRIQSVNFLSSGKKLLVVGETPLIKIWDTTTWNLCTEWNVMGTGQLTTAKVQGNQIAIAQGNSLQLWHLP